MNIAISAGHNVYNGKYFDNGSMSRGLKEAEITKSTVRYLKDMLTKLGHSVYDVTPYNDRFVNSRSAHDERAKRVNKLNIEVGIDLYLDVHVNAGGGTGPEVLLNARNDVSYSYGRKIVNSIAKATGLYNRGVKNKPNFWSIKMVKVPAIIVEGGFIDSPNGKDMEVLTPELYARSIASVFGNVEVKYLIQNKDVIIDGNKFSIRQIIQDGETFVSLRPFANSVGMVTSWDSKERLADISLQKVNLSIGGKVVSIKGNKIGGTNYGEIREIAESLGKRVEWDGKNRIIVIK